MSNKKLFWIAFFILSCCEFGQIAYSKNIVTSANVVEPNDKKLQCSIDKTTDDCQMLITKLSSHSLPR